jgi:thioredoxin 1
MESGAVMLTGMRSLATGAGCDRLINTASESEQRMATSLDLQVTDATFLAEVEQAAGLVVVDFWAEWCGPCRAVGPVIEKLAEDYRGKVKVLKLDTDANQATAARFNIRSIPSILFFKDGKPVDGVIGADPRLRSILDEKIQKHVEN